MIIKETINNTIKNFILSEYEIKKENYLSFLNESESNQFQNVSKLFFENNKLSNDLENDLKYLKEFNKLLEDDDFDPFSHLQLTDKINEKEDCLLSISFDNAKLDHPYISLPAGYTCPFADKCKTLVPRDREKFHDKLVQDYGDLRCYAASEEARYPGAQKMRWRNLDLLNKFDKQGKINLILESLDYFERNKRKIDVFRIHESGDFYNLDYFDAWVEVAKKRPDILFYAYTKSLPFWIKRRFEIPKNLKLIASVGGKSDENISKYDLRHAIVVNTPEEAQNLNLNIDIDDTLAYNSDQNFALLLHGTQKAGTEKSKQAYKNREILRNIKSKKIK